MPFKAPFIENKQYFYSYQYSLFFQKVLFALCALNALTTAVCLMAAALRYLQIFTTRASCMVRSHLLGLRLAALEADTGS